MTSITGADVSREESSGAYAHLKPEIVPSNSARHFWVSSGPFFELALIVSPRIACSEFPTLCIPDASVSVSPDIFASPADIAAASELNAAVSGGEQTPASDEIHLLMFDADGYVINEVRTRIKPRTVSVFEMESLMGACKFESGLKHAHLAVEASQSYQLTMRVHGRDSSCLVPEPRLITPMRRGFFPLSLSRERFPMIALLNTEPTVAAVRGRLFCGSRTPEAVWELPPLGVRLVSIVHEFGDLIEVGAEDQLQAYLRLSVRGDYSVRIQLIERVQGPKEGSLYLAMS